MTSPDNTQNAQEPYVHLMCLGCEEVWDIDFTNKTESPALYAMAIEQKIGDGCPDCGGELVVVEKAND